MKIHISDGARECMLDYPQYSFEQRGTVEVKVFYLRSPSRLIPWPPFVFLQIQKEANDGHLMFNLIGTWKCDRIFRIVTLKANIHR